MRRYDTLRGLVVALVLAMAAIVPAIAQDDNTTAPTQPTMTAPSPPEPGTVGQETTTTTTTETTTQTAVVPTGQGWYAAASNIGQGAWMSRGAPWSNDLTQVQGSARVAVIDSKFSMGGGTATTSTGGMSGTDRLITGVSQWVDPSDNSTWEVHFTGIDTAAPYQGLGVMRPTQFGTVANAPSMPSSLSFISLFGPVDVLHNGQTVATGLPGQLLVTEGIRDPQTGHLLTSDTMQPSGIQMHLLVQGNIPGWSDNSLYVFWPNATLDLRNLSMPPALTPSEMQTAQAYFTAPAGTATSAVAGFRGTEENLQPLLTVSLLNRYLARSTYDIAAGDVLLQVVNNSNQPQGFHIEGPGLSQNSAILAPGEQTTLQVHLMPGTYRVASFTAAEPAATDYMHWDTINVHEMGVLTPTMAPNLRAMRPEHRMRHHHRRGTKIAVPPTETTTESTTTAPSY